jgi:hypothetical protein
MRVSRTPALAIVVGVIAVLGSPCPAGAQNVSADPLSVRMPDDATGAEVELIVSIATRLGVPLGFEAVGALSERISMPFDTRTRPSPSGRIVSVRPRPLDLRGRPLREALDAVVAADRRYEWRDVDGVAVVRQPVTAAQLEDAGVPMEVEGGTLFDLLNAIVRTQGQWQWSLRSEVSTIFLDHGRAVTVATPALRLGSSAGAHTVHLSHGR